MMPEEISNSILMAMYMAVEPTFTWITNFFFFRTVPNLLCKETVDLLRKCKIEAMFESNTAILYDGASPAQSGIRSQNAKRDSND